MSAELLRRAAAEMRRRAEAATPSGEYPTGWAGAVADGGDVWLFGGPTEDGYRTGTVLHHDESCDAGCCPPSSADVEHVASWHPGVALAVADLLEKWAWMVELDPDMGGRVGGDEVLNLARTYLDEQP